MREQPQSAVAQLQLLVLIPGLHPSATVFLITQVKRQRERGMKEDFTLGRNSVFWGYYVFQIEKYIFHKYVCDVFQLSINIQIEISFMTDLQALRMHFPASAECINKSDYNSTAITTTTSTTTTTTTNNSSNDNREKWSTSKKCNCQ